MRDYRFLNRCAVIATPKTPFLDWMKKSGDIDEPLLTEVKKESNIYLIPDYESEDDIALANREASCPKLYRYFYQ